MALDISVLEDLCKECSNWGKWGADDELGTLNYITPDKVVAASRLVRTGKVFGLALPYDANGPQRGLRGRFNPIRLMISSGADPGSSYSDDVVTMPTQCGTQWDSLAHVFYHGKMWNGLPQELVTTQGAAKNSIDKMKDSVVSRGVLLDVAHYKGVDWLREGYAITGEDLDGAAAREGVVIGRGDIVLVRTGHMAQSRAQGSWGTYAGGDAPGLGLLTARWLHGKEVAALITDTWGVEVRPNEIPEAPNLRQHFHRVAIPYMGLLLGEIFDLDVLAADCAADGVWEFLFAGPPLPFTGGVGSPCNPVAVK